MRLLNKNDFDRTDLSFLVRSMEEIPMGESTIGLVGQKVLFDPHFKLTPNSKNRFRRPKVSSASRFLSILRRGSDLLKVT